MCLSNLVYIHQFLLFIEMPSDMLKDASVIHRGRMGEVVFGLFMEFGGKDVGEKIFAHAMKKVVLVLEMSIEGAPRYLGFV